MGGSGGMGSGGMGSGYGGMGSGGQGSGGMGSGGMGSGGMGSGGMGSGGQGSGSQGSGGQGSGSQGSGSGGPVARFTVPWYLGMTPLEFCVRAGKEVVFNKTGHNVVPMATMRTTTTVQTFLARIPVWGTTWTRGGG